MQEWARKIWNQLWVWSMTGVKRSGLETNKFRLGIGEFRLWTMCQLRWQKLLKLGVKTSKEPITIDALTGKMCRMSKMTWNVRYLMKIEKVKYKKERRKTSIIDIKWKMKT